jgi:NDP-sugar pyrophosphorylase family protein
MTACVILAAGRGTRMGRVGNSLHKCLTPLADKAIISHQIERMPEDARIIVAVGFRSSQVQEYITLAHPGLDVTYVEINGWDKPGNGPGDSLLQCRDAIGDDHLIFTSCDTLWEKDSFVWTINSSWVALAPIPAGTPPERWCRMVKSSRF